MQKYFDKGFINKDEMESELKMIEKSVASTRGEYHWAAFKQCIVIFRKKQPKKMESNQIQLTMKFETHDIGTGDPKENNGYLGAAKYDNLHDLDPNSERRKLACKRTNYSIDWAHLLNLD